VCNTSIPLLACIERYVFDDILTFYKNQHKADVKLGMREKRKSYFRVNVKNKAPRDTKNESLPLKRHFECLFYFSSDYNIIVYC
jgi:hypothetical protein